MRYFGADKNMTDFGFLTAYKIQVQCCVIIWWGSFQPQPKESHKFVQIYCMGGDQAESYQCANVHNWLDLDIIMEL